MTTEYVNTVDALLNPEKIRQALDPITDAIFAAFKTWINQPSRIDRRDYGQPPEGFKAYRQEIRSINAQRTRARKALKAAQAHPFAPGAMQEALKAFSGRLEWQGDHFEYCTGQYFPTEFAPAAATVLERYVDIVRPKFTPTEEQQGQWWDIGMIERANHNAGFHWFEPSTKRFFRCRILDTVYQGPGGIFFVSSEKGPSERRLFTVREFTPKTADVDTFGEFNSLSRSTAQRMARIASEERAAAVEWWAGNGMILDPQGYWKKAS